MPMIITIPKDQGTLLNYARWLRPLEPDRTRRLWGYLFWLEAYRPDDFKRYCDKFKEERK